MRRGSIGFALALVMGLGSVAVVSAPRAALAHDLVQPKPKTMPAPAWPNGKAENHDVVVPVIVVVGVDGRVENADVEASVSPDFDRAAIEAVKTWTFDPALRDGKPVVAKIRSVVRFAGVTAPASAEEPRVVPPSPPPVAVPPGTPPNAPLAPSAASASSGDRVDTVRVAGTNPPRSASEVIRGRDVVTAAPHRTGSDALNVVPGVFVTQHSGEGKAHQIFLRGFDAVHGQDLELWVGGIPINEVSNIHGQGYADLHFVMPELIREVQATPGTYDPRQGDFAVAGTLRMKLGYAEPGATLKGTVGSFGTRRLFLAYHPKDASDETFAAFEGYETDGFGPNRSARRGSAIAQATHDFSDGLSLRVLATTYTSRFDSAGVVPQDDVEAGRIDRFATLDPKQGGHSSRTQILTELHKDDDGGRWSVAPFVVFRSLQLRQNFTGYFADTQRAGKPRLDSDNNQQLNDSITAGMTASYRKLWKVFSPRDAFEVGVYGRHDTIEQSQRRLSELNDSPTETLVDANVGATNVAGYLDASVNPLRRLAIRGGLRADALAYTAQDRALPDGTRVDGPARSAQGAHFGKKLTLDYALAPKLHVLGSYGEGFRSPQARSLSDGERTFFTTVNSAEVGVRYADAGIAGSAAAFYTNLSEDLVFDPATSRNEKVPGTERKGLAVEGTVRGGDMLLSSSATYTHATFTASNDRYGEGDLLPYVPQLVLRTDATWKRKVARVFDRDVETRIGTGLEGLAGRPLPFSESGKNVFIVDTSAGVRVKEVELSLDVFNLFDADWYDGQFVYASNFGRAASPGRVPFRHVTIGPPRTFWLSLTLYV